MKIVEHDFSNQEVILDFHEYENCMFRNCRFVVLGFGPFSLNKCEVIDCQFTFAGPAANTIQTMTALYQNNGEQGKQLIEATFNAIRTAQPQPGAGQGQPAPVQ